MYVQGATGTKVHFFLLYQGAILFYVYIVPFYRPNPQARSRSVAGRKPGAEGSNSGIRKSSASILGSRIIDGKYIFCLMYV